MLRIACFLLPLQAAILTFLRYNIIRIGVFPGQLIASWKMEGVGFFWYSFCMVKRSWHEKTGYCIQEAGEIKALCRKGASNLLRLSGRIGKVLFVVFAPLGFASNAWALQVHGAPEGLYVHQMAHLYYIFALGFFSWNIRSAAFAGRGWNFLQLFCFFMVLWNVLAFCGHIVGVYLPLESLSKPEQYLHAQLFGPFTFDKILFFAAKLDHLLCVPALFFLFLGIRSFYRNAVAEARREEP